jgi:hypothetical protein
MTLRQLAGVREGLDEKGAVLLTVLPGKENGPMPLLFIPVTDYAKFIAQFKPGDATGEVVEFNIGRAEFAATKKGSYAVLTEPRQRDRLKEAAAEKTGSLGLAAALISWIGKHDAYFVAMPDGIKQAVKPIRNGLEEAKRSFPADNEQLKNVAAVFEIYDQILAGIEKEVTHFGVGLRIDDGTIYINSQSTFVPGGSLARAAADVKAPAERGLALVPSGQYLLAFDGVFPESWFKGLGRLSAQFMGIMSAQSGKELSDEDLKRMTEAMENSMRGIQSMAFRMGILRPDRSLYDSMSGVLQVEDARQYVANYEKTAREMSKLFDNAGHPVFKSYKVAKADVDGVAALELAMDMSGMLDAAGDPMQRKMMEMMFGPGGKLTAYIAPADADTVAMAYSKEALRATLDSVKNKGEALAADEDIQRTLKLLPGDAQWIGFLSPKGVVDSGKTIVQQVAPGIPGQLPPFPDTPPVGFGARMTAEGLETSLVIPKDVLAGIGAYSQTMRQNFGPPPQPGPPQKRPLQR